MYRNQGNEAFKNQQYESAYDLYTKVGKEKRCFWGTSWFPYLEGSEAWHGILSQAVLVGLWPAHQGKARILTRS